MRSITQAALIGCILSVNLAASSMAADTSSAAKAPAAEASIPFANHGGIRNWTVLDKETLLIESTQGKWYLAKLMSPAFDLPFVEAVGFKTTPSGTLDKFSSVIVKGRAYPLVSLTRTDPPKKKPALKKSDNKNH